jgi:hypothetical protein
MMVVTHALSGNLENAAEDILILVTPQSKRSWQSADPEIWAKDSFERAKDTVYKLPEQPERTGFEFPTQHGQAASQIKNCATCGYGIDK